MKKNRIFKQITLSLILMSTTSYALSPVPEWKEFSVSNYANNDYTLRDDIAYFELRKYLFDTTTDKQISDKYIPYLKIYKKALSSYPSKVIEEFQQIPFLNGQVESITKISTDAPRYKFKVKGFIIKNSNKFWTINEKKDLIWLFDKIDTPAELYQFLRINNLLGYTNSYKIEDDGYRVKQVKVEYKSEKKSKGDFDEYTEYQIHTTHIYDIKSNGEFTKEFLSTTKTDETKTKVASGFHGEPGYIFGQATLNEILMNPSFVTPPKKRRWDL